MRRHCGTKQSLHKIINIGNAYLEIINQVNDHQFVLARSLRWECAKGRRGNLFIMADIKWGLNAWARIWQIV
jgi:hypothetical protein